MHPTIHDPIQELRTLFASLGTAGGRISPSVYDTAQLLRLYPQQTEPTAVVDWLLTQQQADGGWGDTNVPIARTVPTFSALIALHEYRRKPSVQSAIDGALTFLAAEEARWIDVNLDALALATEMILPYLIEVALAQGYAVNKRSYRRIYQIQEQKLKLIQGKRFRPGSPSTYSWEAFWGDALQIEPDCSGGIGHSPAATASWLCQAEQHAHLAPSVTEAQHYLVNAANATGVGIPGVVPNVWPITGFELSYAPYVLLVTSLLKVSALQSLMAPLLDELCTVLERGNGVSFGEYFTPDVDDTSLAIGVLGAYKRTADPSAILQFKVGEHFCTFHQELNPSVLVNAHALYGLIHLEESSPTTEEFLCSRQQDDGRWLADKFHSSWLYTTLEVIIVLNHLGYRRELQRALQALTTHQNANGSWGNSQGGSRLETSYALIALALIQSSQLLSLDGYAAMARGHQWLQRALRDTNRPEEKLWVGKELYSPYRVDRIYEWSALLVSQPERAFA